jgi:TRAP-type mannitol/chloroaromatic compound transport system permease large subunit
VLWLLGTDRFVADLIAAIPPGELIAVVLVLGAVALCAFVLDAFEIIFVVVALVLPPLLVHVADARWVAVLLLLALQSSFLLPPFGYALMMVHGSTRDPAPFAPFVRALLPFLVAQWLVVAVVLAFPELVHLARGSNDMVRTPVTMPGR